MTETMGDRSLQLPVAPPGAEVFTEEGFEVALVIAEHKGSFIVRDGPVELPAEVTGKIMFTASGREDYPVVGDWVAIQKFDDNSGAVIHHVLPRTSCLARKAAGNRPDIQLIAANVRTVFIMQSLDNDFNLRRLERYIVAVRESGAEPVVLLSKEDLISDADKAEHIEAIRRIAPDISVYSYSSRTGSGMDEVGSRVSSGGISCFVGSSGVGKSTLVNKLAGEEILATREVREKDSRGRHATSVRQMIFLKNGGVVIDTPGMREFGIVESESGLQEAFSDIYELAESCRFPGCTHRHEPDCAVRAAVDSGELDAKRFANFIKLTRENAYYSRTKLEQRQREKKFGKMCKEILKNKKNKY